MIRVMLIARYRDTTMRRKIDLLAQQPGMAITFIYPRWKRAGTRSPGGRR